MSKIKAYIDSSVLINISNGSYDIKKLVEKVSFVSSLPAVLEFVINDNLYNSCDEILDNLSLNMKFRGIDHQVLSKFSSLAAKKVRDQDFLAQMLHLSIALLEECSYFICSKEVCNKIKSIDFTGINCITFDDLEKNLIKNNDTLTLFD